MSQRGEGRIGCILSLLALIALAALTDKLLPVFYSNYSLAAYAEEVGDRAGLFPPEALALQVRDKARDLRIPEALGEGAVTVATTGEQASGVCTITLAYRRNVDLFGLYAFTVDTRKTIQKTYLDAR